MNCEYIAEVEESYLLREMEAAEMEQIERHLKQCPRCARRLAGYEELLGRMLVSLQPVTPPSAIRPALMAEVAGLPAPLQLKNKAPVQQPPPLRARRSWKFRLAYNLAASLLLLALAGLSLFTSSELQTVNARQVEAQKLLELTTSPDSWIWAMTQPDKPFTPTAPRARMYARASSDLYLITATNLPPPPPGYYYKAWYNHDDRLEFAGGLSPVGEGSYTLKVNDPTRSGAAITGCFINVEAKESSLSQPTAPPFLQWNKA